jgi:hypothetical protein
LDKSASFDVGATPRRSTLSLDASMDGTVDYSRHSRADLEEALRNIDGARYPQNLASLKRELAIRPPAQPEDPRVKTRLRGMQIARYTRYVRFYFFIAAAVQSYIFLFKVNPAALFKQMADVYAIIGLWKSGLMLTVIAADLLLPIATALFLFFQRRYGYFLGFLTALLQIPYVALPGFEYKFIPLLTAQAYWSQSSFGFTYSFESGARLSFGGHDPVTIGIDVLSIIIAWICWKQFSVGAEAAH